jgi:hypothetical protein
MCMNRYSIWWSDLCFPDLSQHSQTQAGWYFRLVNQSVWHGILYSRAPAAGIMKLGGGRVQLIREEICVSNKSAWQQYQERVIPSPNIRVKTCTLREQHSPYWADYSPVFLKKESKCFMYAWSKGYPLTYHQTGSCDKQRCHQAVGVHECIMNKKLASTMKWGRKRSCKGQGLLTCYASV